MLRPTKHSHPDRTVISLSLLLLARLRTRRLDTFSDLFAFARKSVVGGDVLVLPSMNFLYLLGLVEYHPKTDSFEYVGQK
jgi:hypothetical protein